ncbi:SGNH/GDSL hydrolase family protein [Mesorhizobium sp. CAU 1732]|uniref:SGNH/GDSL hydrolase family protein n=1 Tax=Mesorhizobium sp. CAU 1732 TaxID=3140358 RepID=UPI0032611917
MKLPSPGRALAGVVGVALLAELVLRQLGMASPPLYTGDPAIGYLMAAEQDLVRFGARVRINKYHQRSDELVEQPESDTVRILFLGDSITFGIATLDQRLTYPEIVRSSLQKIGWNVEVANASAPSWGIGNLRAYTEKHGIFGSAIVIVQIGSADLLQPTSTDEMVGKSPAMPDRKPLTATGQVLTRYVMPRVASTLRMSQTTEPESSVGSDDMFQTNMEHFTALIRDIQDSGAQPLVLYVPGLWEIAPPDGVFFTDYFDHRDRFMVMLGTLAIPVIRLDDEWRMDPYVGRLYSDGTHFREAGNHAISAAITKRLVEMAPTQ